MEKLKALPMAAKIGIVVAIVVLLILVIVLPAKLSGGGSAAGGSTQQAPPEPSVEYLGCKADCETHTPVGDRMANRSLGYYKGDMTYEQCKDLARTEGFKYFGLQYHEGVNGGDLETAQCFMDNALQYDRPQEGSVHGAPCVTNAAGKAMGSGCSNATYSWNNVPGMERMTNGFQFNARLPNLKWRM